jgi:beta-lactam-binding protein with PASTA domain
MKLGGSLGRSRGRKKKAGRSGKKKPQGFISSRLEFLKNSRFLWRLGLLALVGLAGGYVISTQFLFPAPPPPGDLTRVPDLAGEPLVGIPDLLSGSGLYLGRVDSLRHPTVLEGVVLGQSPLSGQLSLVGDSVRVAVSLGPEQRPVPDIMRLRADRAQTVLEASGFEVVVDSIESEVPRGSVVAMEPEAGTEAIVPQEIILTVSMGPPMVEMPLFLGLQEEQAIAVADSLGLVVAEVESRFRFGRDQGLVVEQEPPATTLVERGAAIRLVVGRRGG